MVVLMNEARRRVIGLLLLTLAVALVVAIGVSRIRAADRTGWAAMSYIPPVRSTKPGPKKPRPGFGALQPGAIMMVYPGGPAARAGLKQGDEVVSLNGLPATDLKGLTALAQRTRTGDVITYRVKRNGQEKAIPVRFDSPLSSTPIVASLVVNTAVALTFVAIGVFVFWRRPMDARARIFYAMTVAAAGSFMGGVLAQIENTSLRGIGLEPTILDFGRGMVLIATTMFFAPLLLHLSLIFPAERPVYKQRGRIVLKWIYGLPLYVCFCALLLTGLVGAASQPKAFVRAVFFSYVGILAVATLVAIVRIVKRVRRESFREAALGLPFESMTALLALLSIICVGAGWITRSAKSPVVLFIVMGLCALLFIAIVASYPIATVVSLYRSYKESGVEERRQVKWPLWGTMVAVGTRLVLLAIGISVGLAMTFMKDFPVSPLAISLPDIISKSVYTLIPLSFAFAILKYRLMNIDVIIRRTVLYSILTGVVFILYAVVVASIGTALVKLAGVTNQTMLVASTVVIALVTVPLRNRLQFLVDRNLFRVRRDYPLALRNISDAISTSGAVDVFLRKGVEEVQQAVQNRFVILALRRDAEYVATAKVGVADEIIGKLRLPVSGFDFHSTAFPESLRRLGTETIVPLPVGQPPKGFLALGTRLSDEEFSETDIQFIQSAAAQIGLGIENVRLRDEEADFEQARAMQQILLPKSIPQLPGFRIAGLWQPARSVGGDYYDTLSLGDTRAGICIADVAGKGMPAALLMANLQAAVKATASFEATPAAVCDRVKNIVSGNLAGGKFISLVYGVLDSASRTFTYCNAGHNPPIVVRSNGEVERLMRGGPAVCRLFRNAIHEDESIELRSGDRVVLFTDGVSEARRGEEEFGEERLIELLVASRAASADDLQTKLLTRLREFTAGDFSDDVTLVVIAAD